MEGAKPIKLLISVHWPAYASGRDAGSQGIERYYSLDTYGGVMTIASIPEVGRDEFQENANSRPVINIDLEGKGRGVWSSSDPRCGYAETIVIWDNLGADDGCDDKWHYCYDYAASAHPNWHWVEYGREGNFTDALAACRNRLGDNDGGFIIGISGDDDAPGLYFVPKPQRGN